MKILVKILKKSYVYFVKFDKLLESIWLVFQLELVENNIEHYSKVVRGKKQRRNELEKRYEEI